MSRLVKVSTKGQKLPPWNECYSTLKKVLRRYEYFLAHRDFQGVEQCDRHIMAIIFPIMQNLDLPSEYSRLVEIFYTWHEDIQWYLSKNKPENVFFQNFQVASFTHQSLMLEDAYLYFGDSMFTSCVNVMFTQCRTSQRVKWLHLLEANHGRIPLPLKSIAMKN